MIRTGPHTTGEGVHGCLRGLVFEMSAQEHVEHNLRILLGTHDAALRAASDKWLGDLHRDENAWEVAMALVDGGTFVEVSDALVVPGSTERSGGQCVARKYVFVRTSSHRLRSSAPSCSARP